MWYRNRVWMRYIKNILAADKPSAEFLADYMRRRRGSKEQVASIEIYDLQRYRVIRNAAKLKGSLREKVNKPFIFVSSKN